VPPSTSCSSFWRYKVLIDLNKRGAGDKMTNGNMSATRLWFARGKNPQDSDFAPPMGCEFWSLWDAVEDAGDAILKGSRPNGLEPWIKYGSLLLDERAILIRYEASIGRPRDHKP
jgi:hypothetical protein